MNHALPLMLLADLFEVIGSLVGLFFLVLWVVRQIMEAQKQPAAGRGRQAGAPPEAAGRAQAAGGQQADPLRDQVEEFLRRAGRVPPGKQGAPAGREARPMASGGIELLVDDASPPAEVMVAEGVSARETERGETPPPVVASKELNKAKSRRGGRRPVIGPPRETLAERAAARQAARARRLAEQASQLGQRIIKEDQEFDVQLAAKFDHTVGTLASDAAGPSEATPAPPETPAGQIAAMLSNPEGVRQAILVHEILRRPIDRW